MLEQAGRELRGNVGQQCQTAPIGEQAHQLDDGRSGAEGFRHRHHDAASDGIRHRAARDDASQFAVVTERLRQRGEVAVDLRQVGIDLRHLDEGAGVADGGGSGRHG